MKEYKKKLYNTGDVVAILPTVKQGAKFSAMFISNYSAQVFSLAKTWVIVRRYRTPKGAEPRYIIRAEHLEDLDRPYRACCNGVYVSQDMLFAPTQDKLE